MLRVVFSACAHYNQRICGVLMLILLETQEHGEYRSRGGSPQRPEVLLQSQASALDPRQDMEFMMHHHSSHVTRRVHVHVLLLRLRLSESGEVSFTKLVLKPIVKM
ncbi:hypothetical protein JOB18_018793 [Solea senegalensis]|uniref:Uncharacterized protein n=1 Tax=Solea senegalensis TaxID=28829 RepID=A0AAV6QP14_SOLSE|nr:hypothetical protein JOB18_018793 [Solea senegalensis]